MADETKSQSVENEMQSNTETINNLINKIDENIPNSNENLKKLQIELQKNIENVILNVKKLDSETQDLNLFNKLKSIVDSFSTSTSTPTTNIKNITLTSDYICNSDNLSTNSECEINKNILNNKIIFAELIRLNEEINDNILLLKKPAQQNAAKEKLDRIYSILPDLISSNTDKIKEFLNTDECKNKIDNKIQQCKIQKCEDNKGIYMNEKCYYDLEQTPQDEINKFFEPIENLSICDETISGNLQNGYRGCQNKTINGRTCQKWSLQSPHTHKNKPNERKGTGDHNYCRNPDGEPDGIWCYTTDSNPRWEYCKPKELKQPLVNCDDENNCVGFNVTTNEIVKKKYQFYKKKEDSTNVDTTFNLCKEHNNKKKDCNDTLYCNYDQSNNKCFYNKCKNDGDNLILINDEDDTKTCITKVECKNKANHLIDLEGLKCITNDICKSKPNHFIDSVNKICYSYKEHKNTWLKYDKNTHLKKKDFIKKNSNENRQQYIKKCIQKCNEISNCTMFTYREKNNYKYCHFYKNDKNNFNNIKKTGENETLHISYVKT